MIKLKFDPRLRVIDVLRGNDIITTLDPEDFGSLIQEVKRIMREANPAIARKQGRKEERKALINNLKILLAMRWIDFTVWVKKTLKKALNWYNKFIENGRQNKKQI